jgi:hypothetical protein
MVFIYLTIALLEDNGEACVLIPYGKELMSSSSKKILKLR